MQNTIDKKLEKLFQNTSFKTYHYRYFNDAEDLICKMRDEISKDEITHCFKAMEYLFQNDPRLQMSSRLAFYLGIQTMDITSELLATILKQNKLDDELLSLEDDIKKIYLESFTHNLSEILDKL